MSAAAGQLARDILGNAGPFTAAVSTGCRLAAEVLRLHQVARDLDVYLDHRLDVLGPHGDVAGKSVLLLVKNRLRELLEATDPEAIR